MIVKAFAETMNTVIQKFLNILVTKMDFWNFRTNMEFS